jgi:small subunit ribosomal protein S13
MIYILETKLYENNSIFFELKNIYGIGNSKSSDICKKLGFAKNLKVKNLTEDQIKRLLKVADNSNLIITSDLKKFKNLILKNLISIKSYRGLRRIKGLPVRGQRTHTNSRTSRKIKL